MSMFLVGWMSGDGESRFQTPHFFKIEPQLSKGPRLAETLKRVGTPRP